MTTADVLDQGRESFGRQAWADAYAQPSAVGQLALVQKTEAQPERALGGSRCVAQTQGLVIRTRPDVGAIGVPTDQVSGPREPL